MPIKTMTPAHQYGLALMQQSGQGRSFGENAMAPIIAALLQRKAFEQEESRNKDFALDMRDYQTNVANELVPTGVGTSPPVQLGEDPSLRDYSRLIQRASPGEAQSSALQNVTNPDLINALAPGIMQQQASDVSAADARNFEMGQMLSGQRFNRGQQQGQQAYGTSERMGAQDFTAGQNTQQQAAQAAIAAANNQNQLAVANRPLTPEQLSQQTQLRAAGRPITNISTAQEKKFDEKVGEVQGERYAGIVKDADSARSKMQMLQALGPALADAPFTGAGAETLTNATMLAKQLGISDADTSGAELARSLSNQMTMMNRNPAGGAGMPGAMSDADREFLKSTVPGLSNTRGGAAKMIEIGTKVEQRKMEVADLAQQYIEQNGKLDSGFDRMVKDYAEKNPLFASSAGAPDKDGWITTPSGVRIRERR